MTFGPRTKHRFTGMQVVRVGAQIVLWAMVDADKVYGGDLSITIELPNQEQAELYEMWFQRMIDCTDALNELGDDALQATLTLTKGRA